MGIFFISLRLLMPFPKIELAMLFSDNGLKKIRSLRRQAECSGLAITPSITEKQQQLQQVLSVHA
jgi:hypothetical protein